MHTGFSRLGIVPGVAFLLAATFGTSAQEKSLTEAYNASGQVLFQQFAAKPGNIVFSPYSIGTAMAMALSGARGATETEMAKVLMHTLPRAAIDEANGGVLATLNGYDKSAVPPKCPAGMRVVGHFCKGPPPKDGCPYPLMLEGKECTGRAKIPDSAKLATANALMITTLGKQAISRDYATLLKKNYAAEVFNDIEVKDVNDWVKRKTEGKIDKILESLHPMAAAVLVNAVYFKADWATPFVKSETRNEVFHLTPAQKVSVSTMHRTDPYAFVAAKGYRAIRLPYTVRSIGLIVVLPEQIDGVNQIANRLAGGELPQLLTAMRKASVKEVAVALPRFKTSFKVDLLPPFTAAGMKLAFDDAADFSGMTGQKANLKIGQIAHRAVIEVDEEGTEAAAATAIEMRIVSIPPPPEPFRVDRPFLFYLVDDATGAILFQGRINDPR